MSCAGHSFCSKETDCSFLRRHPAVVREFDLVLAMTNFLRDQEKSDQGALLNSEHGGSDISIHIPLYTIYHMQICTKLYGNSGLSSLKPP